MMQRTDPTGSTRAPARSGVPARRPGVAAASLLVLALWTSLTAAAAEPPAPLPSASMEQILGEVRELAGSSATAPLPGSVQPRIEVQVGQLDSRLKLAPCSRIEPYLPAGQRLWGSSRVGLRCRAGAVPWNVYLPVTVRVWAPAVVVSADLPADTELGPEHLRLAEVDLAASASPAQLDPGLLLGRRLAVALKGGAAIRAQHLRARQWFAAGDQVTVVASGAGFSVSATAQALAPGQEGQSVRLRTESGRILSGLPVGAHRVEIRL